MVVNPSFHKEGEDYVSILLQFENKLPFTAEEIQSQVFEANKCNDIQLTSQRLKIWMPLIKKALQELSIRVNNNVKFINPPYSKAF